MTERLPVDPLDTLGIELEPPVGEARVLLVMLHGLGMDPAVLRPFLRSLALPAWGLVPEGPVDTGGGTRAWWAVDPDKRRARLAAGPSDLHDRHPAGRAEAHAALDAALHRLPCQVARLPRLVAGFSQGGMLAVDHALRADGPPPAGLALFSSTCIALDEWAPHWGRLRGMPVLVAHGRDDDDLALSAGERLRDMMIAAGARVRWLPFEGGHGLPLVVWRALRRFVAELAAPLDTPASLPLPTTIEHQHPPAPADIVSMGRPTAAPSS